MHCQIFPIYIWIWFSYSEIEHLTLGTVQLNQAPQQEVISDSQSTPAVISLAPAGSRPNTISLDGLQINIAQVVRCYECCQTFENAQLLQVCYPHKL